MHQQILLCISSQKVNVICWKKKNTQKKDTYLLHFHFSAAAAVHEKRERDDDEMWNDARKS